MELKKQIENSTAHRPIRDLISGYVLENGSAFAELLALSLDVADKNHHKACWNLELVLEKKNRLDPAESRDILRRPGIIYR